MIKIEGLTKKYGKRVIFSDYSYTFPSSGLIALTGESGSGKSTLLNVISGVDLDYSGCIKFDNKNIRKFSEKELCNYRLKNVGYVFQNFNLINTDTIFSNICLPLDTISNEKYSIKRKRILDIIGLVGLKNRKNARINVLSGGEKQRIAIARALINDPKIILCDEPTGALDAKNSDEVLRVLKTISKSKLVIVATHDVESISNVADIIINLDGKTPQVTTLNSENLQEDNAILGVGSVKKNPRVTARYKIRHSFQKIKAKKFRSLFANLMLSLSLTGVGLSMIITSSVSQKVSEAFKEILNGNQIVMTTKNENENTFTNSYSASFKKVNEVFERYNYLLDGIGVNYLVNFENFFKDKNDFYVSSTIKKIDLPAYSTRNINDFKWLKEGTNIFYPYDVSDLDDDQIVLGLPQNEMITLCYNLQIQRSFTSLGHYIYEKGLFVTLDVENKDWEYEDEQLFNVVAVCESNIPTIYHTNPLWNEVVFENMMRLPSFDGDEQKFPWEMYKIFYLWTKSDPSEFLEASLYDETLFDYVFERADSFYNPTLCNNNSVCNENRIYMYSVDKRGLDCSLIKRIAEQTNFKNFYLNSDYGYASYASNIFSGFSRNFFLSLDEDAVDEAIDADNLMEESSNISLNLPDSVVQGNFLNSLNGGLRFSTLFDNIIYGREPTNLNEIVISKGLAERLDKNTLCLGRKITVGSECNESYEDDGAIHKNYRTAEIVVVGVTSESKNYIYHNSNWTISFFRDRLGISSFLLIPRSAVFEFSSTNEASNAFIKFKEFTQDYKFISPLDELQENVTSTLDYANTILKAFSILATVISILLLGTILMLNIIESKEEIKLFHYLGIQYKDIKSMFVYHGLVQGFISFSISAAELVIVDFIISYLLNDALGISLKFSLNFQPIIVIFLMAIILPVLVSKLMLIFLMRKRKNMC